MTASVYMEVFQRVMWCLKILFRMKNENRLRLSWRLLTERNSLLLAWWIWMHDLIWTWGNFIKEWSCNSTAFSHSKNDLTLKQHVQVGLEWFSDCSRSWSKRSGFVSFLGFEMNLRTSETKLDEIGSMPARENCKVKMLRVKRLIKTPQGQNVPQNGPFQPSCLPKYWINSLIQSNPPSFQTLIKMHFLKRTYYRNDPRDQRFRNKYKIFCASNIESIQT